VSERRQDVRICFGPGENPRDALQVLSDEEIAAAMKVMSFVGKDPDLTVLKIEASVSDDEEGVSVEALVSRQGQFSDGSWEKYLKLDAKSRLGEPSGMSTSTTDGESRCYTTVIGGVTVRTVLRRRFPA